MKILRQTTSMLAIVLMAKMGILCDPPNLEAQNTLNSVWPPVATFSILGHDPATGETGGAVQSRVFSVGNGVLWGEAGVGMVATQAIVDVSYGPQGLELLQHGFSPTSVVSKILENDPNPRPETWTIQGRQFSVMNSRGEVATHTGPEASEWAGHVIRDNVSAQATYWQDLKLYKHGRNLRNHYWPPILPSTSCPRSRAGRRWRQTWNAIGCNADR